MFDTHCHLNFKAFDGRVEEVINNAKNAGVSHIVVPGTDIETSQKAVVIAEKFENVYAAVGIHPHHVYENLKSKMLNVKSGIHEIEKLLSNPKVVAVGEVGVDRHYYNKTKYPNYQIEESFIKLQKEFLRDQIELTVKYNKSLILHNREAKADLLKIIGKPAYASALVGKAVLHCCEPDDELLEFAKKHKIYIGVDGDVTYWREKQDFVKKIPLELLVLETDSPFLLPQKLREKNIKLLNEPKNLGEILSYIATKVGVSLDKLKKITEENSKKLFQLS